MQTSYRNMPTHLIDSVVSAFSTIALHLRDVMLSKTMLRQQTFCESYAEARVSEV